MYRAAARLIGTPPPNLSALLAKIEVIGEHELDMFDDMPRQSLNTLREDVAGLIEPSTW
jgi:hypothetical protein